MLRKMAFDLASSDARPLLRSPGLRSLTAFAIVLCALPALGLLTLLAIVISAYWLLWLACTLAVGTLAIAWVTEVGWRPGPVGSAQRALIAFVALVCAGAVVYGAVGVAQTLLELRPLGTPPSSAWPSFACAAAGCFALALLAVLLPLSPSRRGVGRAAFGAAVAGLLAAAAGAGAQVAPSTCGAFDFQPDRWRAVVAAPHDGDAIRFAESVVRCGVVAPGMERAQVRERLGPPPTRVRDREWRWSLGSQPGMLLDGPAGTLTVLFDAGGRVTSATVTGGGGAD